MTPDDDALRRRQVAERVRRYRLESGWTQRELAVRSGLSPGTVSRIELGRETPKGRTAQALGEALGVSASTLLGMLGQGSLFPSPDELRMDLIRRLASLPDADVERAYAPMRAALEESVEPRPLPRRPRGSRRAPDTASSE